MQKASWFHNSIHPAFMLKKGAESDFVPLIDGINGTYERKPNVAPSLPMYERHFLDVTPEDLTAAQSSGRPVLYNKEFHRRIGKMVENGSIAPFDIPEYIYEQQKGMAFLPHYGGIPWEDSEDAATLHNLHNTKRGQSAILTDSTGRIYINAIIKGWDGKNTTMTQLFYSSTGFGLKGKPEDEGKLDYVEPGTWIPFFGRQEGGHDNVMNPPGVENWIFKQKGIGDAYHAPLYSHIGNYFNTVLGDLTLQQKSIRSHAGMENYSDQAGMEDYFDPNPPIRMYGSRHPIKLGFTDDPDWAIGHYFSANQLTDILNNVALTPNQRKNVRATGINATKDPLSYTKTIQEIIIEKLTRLNHIMMDPAMRQRFGLPGFGGGPVKDLNGMFIESPNYGIPPEDRRVVTPTVTPTLNNKGILEEWKPDLDRQQSPVVPSPEVTPAPVASVTPQKTWFQSLFGANFTPPEPTPKPGGFTPPEPTPKPGGFTPPEPTPKPGGFTPPEPTPKPGGFRAPPVVPTPVPTPVKPVVPERFFIGGGGPSVLRLPK